MDTFNATLRFRIPDELESRLQAVARRRVKKLPEIGREAILAYVEEQESRLGLVPALSPLPAGAGGEQEAA